MNSSPYYSAFLFNLADVLSTVEVDGDQATTIGPVLLVGNGGSASVASHICNDLNKMLKPAFVPDYSTLTCLANDYGWTSALEAWISSVFTTPCTLIAISSSGNSANILNAANSVREKRGRVITLSGFNPDNKLRMCGHTNYYVPSRNYGLVEIAHLAILHGLFNPG